MKFKVMKKGISQREGDRHVERDVGDVIDVAEPGASRFVARGLIARSAEEPVLEGESLEGRKSRRARRRTQEASEVTDD